MVLGGLFVRAASAHFPRHLGRPLLGLLDAIDIGLMGVLGTNTLIIFMVSKGGYLLSIVLLFAAAVGTIIASRPRLAVRPVHALAFWVPFVLHAYLLTAGHLSGVIWQPAVLLVVSLVMLTLGFYWHRAGHRPTPK